jgi:hypothetical protein
MDLNVSVENALEAENPVWLVEIYQAAYLRQLVQRTIEYPAIYGDSPSILARLQSKLEELPGVTAAQGLRAQVKLQNLFEQWHNALVKQAHADGNSWTEIGNILGVTRQAAWDRHHDADGDPYYAADC